jgi:hypothetical protein
MPDRQISPRKSVTYWVIATLLMVGALLIVPIVVVHLVLSGWSVNGMVGGLFVLLGTFIAVLGAIRPQVFWKYYGVKSPERSPDIGIDSDAGGSQETAFALHFTPFVIWGIMIIAGGLIYYFHPQPMILLGFIFGGLVLSEVFFRIYSRYA